MTASIQRRRGGDVELVLDGDVVATGERDVEAVVNGMLGTALSDAEASLLRRDLRAVEELES